MQRRKLADLRSDRADIVGPVVVEVPVVRHHASEHGRIALVQQQLDLLLAAAHVGGAHLGGQVIRLELELGFALRDGGVQLPETLAAVGPFPFDIVEAQPLLGDRDLGFLQLPGQPVAVPRAPVHALLEVTDLLADLFEFLLLDLGETAVIVLGDGSRRRGEEQQDQGRQVAHGRTV